MSGDLAYLGLSEASPKTIIRAHKTHPITAVQSEYSLWTRDPEDGVLDVLRELGIGFVAYSPLGRGFLTGAIRSTEELPDSDYRKTNPRFVGENFERNAVTTLWPDADHARWRKGSISPGADAMLFGPHTARLLRAAQGTGVDARTSRNAGSYLCNYLSWRTIEAAQTGGGLRDSAVEHLSLPETERVEQFLLGGKPPVERWTRDSGLRRDL